MYRGSIETKITSMNRHPQGVKLAYHLRNIRRESTLEPNSTQTALSLA
jgi:hypothetical protein